jgi:ATP-binding cassette subfamily B multidrug efflux pump
MSTTDRNGARPATATPADADETARAARGMAAQRRPGGGGPPWASLGVPTEKASSFGPSARRLLGRLAPHRLGVVAVLVLGVVSVALNVVGPVVLGRATDLIFAGVLGRQLPAGISTAQAAADARAAGDDTTATLIVSQNVIPGVGVDFAALGRVLLFVVAIYVAASLLATCRAGCSTASCSGPSRRCAATWRTSCTGCRCPTSTPGRAASCSAASPTTSTTSPRACSRR